uniref:Cytochrome P450 n=1 Tax=Bracon brevicornis TaxID=1563983 RepID=A0A6V7I4F0_9HYME
MTAMIVKHIKISSAVGLVNSQSARERQRTNMCSFTFYIVTVVTLLLFALYKYLSRNNGYWSARGIPEPKSAMFLFGHAWDLFFVKKNMGTITADYYRQNKNASMFGLYMGPTPVLIVKHPDLVKFVLHSGFSYFAQNFQLNKKTDPLLYYDPFFQADQMWKDSRGIFVSAFSAKKLKDRVSAIKDTCDQMLDYLKKTTGNGPYELEGKDFFSNYTGGVAARAILGIDAHTFDGQVDRYSLRNMMDTILVPQSDKGFKHNLIFMFPFLAKIISIAFVPMWINRAYAKIVDELRALREKEATPRNDVLQHISEYLKEKGMDKDELAAHSFSFFIEQYETSSLTMSFIMYFTAKYPEVQEKMRAEVDEIMRKYGTTSSYEAINDMTYIEQVALECLRLYTPVGRLTRFCTKEVTLEGPDGLRCTLKPGDEVGIPVNDIHLDPEHWKSPEEFNPDRFSKENQKARNKYVYLAFGEGPRLCPGARMGLMQVKAGVAAILNNYSIELSEKMKEPLELDPRYFMTTIRGGYWIRLRPRT